MKRRRNNRPNPKQNTRQPLEGPLFAIPLAVIGLAIQYAYNSVAHNVVLWLNPELRKLFER